LFPVVCAWWQRIASIRSNAEPAELLELRLCDGGNKQLGLESRFVFLFFFFFFFFKTGFCLFSEEGKRGSMGSKDKEKKEKKKIKRIGRAITKKGKESVCLFLSSFFFLNCFCFRGRGI
jgi:hypothetical protein